MHPKCRAGQLDGQIGRATVFVNHQIAPAGLEAEHAAKNVRKEAANRQAPREESAPAVDGCA